MGQNPMENVYCRSKFRHRKGFYIMNKRYTAITGMALSAAVILLSGCAAWERKTAERSPGTMVDDKKITMKVKQELSAEPVFKFNDVEVKTFNGVVQLSGFVNSNGQKQRAAELAQQVPGVVQVVNSITLKDEALQPTGRPNYDPNAPHRTYR
jgi:hyperosmotically inducible periplasmic protein